MDSDNNLWAEIDEQGRLVLPAEAMEIYGIQPGVRVRIEKSTNHLRLHRPVTSLTKVYVETTDLCNLNCTICIRNGWDEPLGRMSQSTFDRILAGLKQLPRRPTIFFGGLGEPLYHPKTVEWVAAAKALGSPVELITNGTTLTEKRSRQLIDAGLDTLWVSIDGATPESYSDVRLGAALPKVLANVARFRQMRRGGHQPKPEIGIAFVAMRRNIADLPEVLKIGRQLGARHFSVSNLMPYAAEMQDEMLYTRTLNDITYLTSSWLPKLSLPKMDIDDETREPFFQALNSGCNVNFAGNSLSGANDVCNFIENGTMSISWDGSISPCWPLMHNHISYLHKKEHRTRRHVIGNVNDHDLGDLWLDASYVAYREKVQSFGFAPCTFCGGCELSEKNEEDCLGNEFPACGCCLWSQGVIQCP
jgi:MoaA/NifB/PqqE/SkfB family radical SAM enzyme